MNLEKAKYLTLNKMELHGLSGWAFEWTRATREYGRCGETKRTIYLSKVLTAIVDEAHVLDTILHEIAHALVGCKHGHNSIWKAKAKEIGCVPNATCNRAVTDDELPPKWVMLFEGEIVNRYMRKPRKTTFDRLFCTWLPGRKDETYGKLTIEEYKKYVQN